jgi:hypothetical protein
MAATEPAAGEVSTDNTVPELADGGEDSTLSANALSLSAAPQAQIANVGASMAQTDGGTAPLAMTDSAEPTMADAEDSEADEYTGLQALVTKALAKVTGTLSGRIKVVLAANTTYEGDVTISAGAREVAADGFELELSAEDAGDDGMDGEGATVIAGKLTIKGIKVIMNSVVMAAGNVIEVTAERFDPNALKYYALTGSAVYESYSVRDSSASLEGVPAVGAVFGIPSVGEIERNEVAVLLGILVEKPTFVDVLYFAHLKKFLSDMP